MGKRFSKREAVAFGWETATHNLPFFVGLLLAVGALYAIPNLLGRFAEAWVRGIPESFQTLPFKLLSAFTVVIVVAAAFVAQFVGQLGLLKIALRFCDGEKGRFSDLFSCFPLFFTYLFGSLLYGLIVVGGVLLLIVPGIIWAIQFQFYAYAIIDKGLGPIAALKYSSRITRGAKWDLFLFGFLTGLVILLGAVALWIGLFAPIPTAMVASGSVYRKLQPPAESEASSPSPSTTPAP